LLSVYFICSCCCYFVVLFVLYSFAVFIRYFFVTLRYSISVFDYSTVSFLHCSISHCWKVMIVDDCCYIDLRIIEGCCYSKWLTVSDSLFLNSCDVPAFQLLLHCCDACRVHSVPVQENSTIHWYWWPVVLWWRVVLYPCLTCGDGLPFAFHWRPVVVDWFYSLQRLTEGMALLKATICVCVMTQCISQMPIFNVCLLAQLHCAFVAVLWPTIISIHYIVCKCVTCLWLFITD